MLYNYYIVQEVEIDQAGEKLKPIDDLIKRRGKNAKVLKEHSFKLTTQPGQQKQEDLILFKKQGLSDKNLLDITLIVAYFNFVNKIALGIAFNPD